MSLGNSGKWMLHICAEYFNTSCPDILFYTNAPAAFHKGYRGDGGTTGGQLHMTLPVIDRTSVFIKDLLAWAIRASPVEHVPVFFFSQHFRNKERWKHQSTSQDNCEQFGPVLVLIQWVVASVMVWTEIKLLFNPPPLHMTSPWCTSWCEPSLAGCRVLPCEPQPIRAAGFGVLPHRAASGGTSGRGRKTFLWMATRRRRSDTRQIFTRSTTQTTRMCWILFGVSFIYLFIL